MKTRWVWLASIAVLSSSGMAFAHEEKSEGSKGGHEAEEKKLSLTDLPLPAQMTVAKEVAGGKITEIEKKTSDKGTVYEVEVEPKEGKKFELMINADGKLLKKNIED